MDTDKKSVLICADKGGVMEETLAQRIKQVKEKFQELGIFL